MGTYRLAHRAAKLNRAEPYEWLKAALEAIAAGHPNSRIDEAPALALPELVKLNAGCLVRTAYICTA